MEFPESQFMGTFQISVINAASKGQSLPPLLDPAHKNLYLIK